MKKIIMSLMAIAMTVGVVSSAAYALFSDTATVNGITIATGNADLRVSGTSSGFQNNWNVGLNLTGIYPGYTASAPIFLENNSSSDIPLEVKARLTAANNWPNLSGDVQMRVVDVDSSEFTSWYTLAQWNATERSLPGDPIAHTDAREYIIEMRVPSTANNSIAGQTLSNITFTLTATQVVAP